MHRVPAHVIFASVYLTNRFNIEYPGNEMKYREYSFRLFLVYQNEKE